MICCGCRIARCCAISQPHPVFRIGALHSAARAMFGTQNNISLAIGGDVTFYSKPSILDPIYGDNPVSWKLFVPHSAQAKMEMTSHR
jgi:hypothetical protein